MSLHPDLFRPFAAPAHAAEAEADRRRHRRALVKRMSLAAFAAPALLASAPAQATSLARIRERGSLVVALYHDMPPFHERGVGIDVEIARRLAEGLGVRFEPLAFHADENMGNDLRHMVWRGHYLGHGPADVLIHVPVDPPLMNANPRVQIFAPYYRERIALARSVSALPRLESMAGLKGQTVAVSGTSLAGWLMLGADGGAYRDQIRTRFQDGTDAARALLDGQVTVAAGNLSELESVLRGDPRFVIEPLPSPRAPRDGWAVGLAVKKESTELAHELQRIMNGLAASGQLASLFEAGRVSWKPV